MFIDLPLKSNSYYPPGIDHVLHPDLLFVFGSNLFGRHGKGSALAARKKYGAIYGQGVGAQGRSYGIPTKDGYLKILDLIIIESYVEDFKNYMARNPLIKSFVCAVGTLNAGYDHSDIAPMFKGLENCWFDERWKPFI